MKGLRQRLTESGILASNEGKACMMGTDSMEDGDFCLFGQMLCED